MAQNPITGVVLRDGALECTTLKTVKGRIELVGHKTVPVSVESGEPAMGSAEAVTALRTACGHVHSDLCVTVPADKSLLRVVDLPTIDPAEIRGMAELQVDKFSPFPVEHMAVSYETLSQKENTSRVLIAAIQRDAITAIGDSFRKVGLLPHWIDIDVLGWWHLLKENGGVPEQGRYVILLMDKTSTELMVCQDGLPVVFRSLGVAAGISEEEFFDEVVEELSYTLTSLEAERGAVDGVRLGLWRWALAAASAEESAPASEAPVAGAEPPKLALATHAGLAEASAGVEAFAHRLREGCGVEVETKSLESLPPLSEGVARRTLARGDTAVNLAPPDWRSEEQSRTLNKTLLISTGAFLAVWLCGVLAFWGGLKLQRDRLGAIKAEVAKMEAPAEQVRQLKEKIVSFEQYADRSHSALECLREVSALLPAGVDLTSFSYKKAGTVGVRGDCASPQPIYDFFRALEQSTLFTEVKPEAIRTKQGPNNAQLSEFSVTASLPGDAKDKETKP